MKILWYALTFILGVFGSLALLRFIELELTSGGFYPIQLVIAIVCIALAQQCLLRARRLK